MRPLGSINAYPGAILRINGLDHFSMGTTLNNTLCAYDNGVRPGDVFLVDGCKYRMEGSGGGDRTPGGVWIERVVS